MNRCEGSSAGEGSTGAGMTSGVNSTVSRLAVEGGLEVVPEFVVRRYAHTNEQATGIIRLQLFDGLRNLVPPT